MTDIFNKILGVLLAFVILAGGPLIMNTMTKELTMKREVLNEMSQLINKVTDNGRLSDLDKSNFYFAIASHGEPLDARIRRYIKVVNPDGAGGTHVTYMLTDNISTWEPGDIIQVQVQAVDYTGAERIEYMLLHLSPPKFEETLSGMVGR